MHVVKVNNEHRVLHREFTEKEKPETKTNKNPSWAEGDKRLKETTKTIVAIITE